MQKLIQIKVHLEIWLIWKASLQATLKVVKLLGRGNAVHRQVDFALVSSIPNDAIEGIAERLISKLGFQVTFTIECRRLDKALRLFIGDLKEDAVSWHLMKIINLDDVANSEFGK